jgi:hypothetical protein
MQMSRKFINSVFYYSSKNQSSLTHFRVLFYHFWQEHAFENSQKYKEGKFIIEMAHMIKDNGWL